MKITDAEKILRSSKNEDEKIGNVAFISSALTKNNAEMGVGILKRTGLLRKIHELSRSTDGLEIQNENSGPVVKRGGLSLAPLTIMPVSYYMDSILGLKGARFYEVYKCLLSSPDILAVLAIYDSINDR